MLICDPRSLYLVQIIMGMLGALQGCQAFRVLLADGDNPISYCPHPSRAVNVLMRAEPKSALEHDVLHDSHQSIGKKARQDADPASASDDLTLSPNG